MDNQDRGRAARPEQRQGPTQDRPAAALARLDYEAGRRTYDRARRCGWLLAAATASGGAVLASVLGLGLSGAGWVAVRGAGRVLAGAGALLVLARCYRGRADDLPSGPLPAAPLGKGAALRAAQAAHQEQGRDGSALVGPRPGCIGWAGLVPLVPPVLTAAPAHEAAAREADYLAAERDRVLAYYWATRPLQGGLFVPLTDATAANVVDLARYRLRRGPAAGPGSGGDEPPGAA